MSNLLAIKNYFEIPLPNGESFKLYYYALCILSGFLSCAILAVPLFKKRGFKPDILLDLFIAVIPCSIILARAWYVIFDWSSFFAKDGTMYVSQVSIFGLTIDEFPKFLNIREGGMAIHGGVCGGALGLFIVSKIKKIKFSALGDLGAALLPLGQAVGRLGNFFNQEVYGAVTTQTWFPYATFIEADGKYHVALCFHEMIFDFLLFLALYFFLFKYNGKRSGYTMALYFMGYGLIRACMEPMRQESFNMGVQILGMPTMFWVSVLVFLGGVALLTTLIVLDRKDGNFWWKDFFKKKSPAIETEENSAEQAEK